VVTLCLFQAICTAALPGVMVPANVMPPEPNTDPVTGYWDCCKPACASHDSPEHETFDTCLDTGLSPGVYHYGDSVCHQHIDVMKNSCHANSSTYNAECLMRVPKIHDDEVYSYVSYTEPPCPKGTTCPKHQFCGACRKLTLNTTDNDTISIYHVQYVNSKPYPANPGPGKMTGYRFLVPGAGMGDYTSGCACTFPGIYTSEVCGVNGTTDSKHCHRFGGMQTETGCEALGDEASVQACKDIKLNLLNNGKYWRTQHGDPRGSGHITVLKDDTVSCSQFDSVMSTHL